MHGRSHPIWSKALLVVLVAGCGASSAGPTERPTAEGAGEGAEAPSARTEPDPGLEQGDEDRAETGNGLLGGLHEQETLTYRVHRANGEALDVQMRIARVVNRGGATAVKLLPMGTELTETAPIFPHWIVGTDRGLYGLEQHVTLTEPGFLPLDQEGELVTEAASHVDWHIPPEWFESAAAGAFHNDPIEGWALVGHRERVEGTVRGEHCVELEREEGEIRRRMLVCANVGMVESAMSGAVDEDPYTWRLVDLGGPTSPQLTEN